MKKFPQFLLTLLATFSFSSISRAKREFPSDIERDVSITFAVPCSVCHAKGNTGSATAITPFALSLRSRGLTGDSNSLKSALVQLQTDGVDSDGDGISDIQELTDGTDPNSSANTSINNDQEPGYGCGGSAPTGHAGPGMGSVVALAWFLVRRRRGKS